MKKGYKFGVQWIAQNDESGTCDSLDVEAVSGYPTTMLLADLFGKETLVVANDIVKWRKNNP